MTSLAGELNTYKFFTNEFNIRVDELYIATIRKLQTTLNILNYNRKILQLRKKSYPCILFYMITQFDKYVDANITVSVFKKSIQVL